MSNMINSQPRFGLEEAGGVVRIFDYATSRYISVTDNPQFDSVDGVWDAQELIKLIKTQQPVYGAQLHQGERTRDEAAEEQRQVAEDQRHDKVEQAKADFMAEDEKPEGEPSPVTQTEGVVGEAGDQSGQTSTGQAEGGSESQQQGEQPQS